MKRIVLLSLTAFIYVHGGAQTATEAASTQMTASVTAPITAISDAAAPQAMTISEVLKSIETSNKDLQAALSDNETLQWELKSQNKPGAFSAEYSPFFHRSVDGVASSELIIKQEFDFPTLYSARRKAADARMSEAGTKFQALRRDILLQAKTLCLNLALVNLKSDLLRGRQANAESLLALVQKRLDSGDATVLELNKVRMDQMSLRTSVASLNGTRRELLASLAALNGGEDIDFKGAEDAFILPEEDMNSLMDKALAQDAALRAAGAGERAAAADLKVGRQAWVPAIDLGYRRNTDGDLGVNGFLVGVSFPLFTGRSKRMAAASAHNAAVIRLDNATLAARSRIASQVAQYQSLIEATEAYDLPLMKETLELLLKAVNAGQISIIQYYVDADDILSKMLACLELRHQCATLSAQLHAFEL